MIFTSFKKLNLLFCCAELLEAKHFPLYWQTPIAVNVLDIVVVFLAKTQSAIALSVFCKIRISWDNFFADLLPKLAFLLLLFF